MLKEKEIQIGRSIQAIRLHIRRLAVALESDRVLLAHAHDEIDSTLEDLKNQIVEMKAKRDNFFDSPH